MLDKNENNLKAWLYLAPALILLLIFTFYPLVNAFYFAFLKEYNPLLGTHNGFTLTENFSRVLKNPNFKTALKNTLVIVFVSVPVSVFIALIISVVLNSIKKFQGFFQTIFFLPYVTNSIAIGMAFAFIFHQDYGLINTMLGWVGLNPVNWIGMGASWTKAMFSLLVYTIWGGLAFKIMVFLGGLQSIDKQYYDAARIDGTPRWRVFTRITVPLLSPMILYITITSFIGAFKAYDTVIGMFGVGLGPAGNSKSMITLVALVYDSLAHNDNIGMMSFASAASIILFFITLLFTYIQIKVSKKRVHY